ncbi:MAG: hypothetical protein POELPBGB_00330 [Bacteroidia bacterium]|nr:hypothetical protein [Bacteroidia bacterium]
MHAETPNDIVRINLFGSGCTIAAGFLENSVYKKLQDYLSSNKLSLEEVLCDYRHLHWLEIDKVRRWQDFGTHLFVSGLFDYTYSFVELKLNKKDKVKIKLSDVYYQYSLFPIYTKEIKRINLSENSTKGKLLVIVETTVGKIGKAEISANNFDITKLLFDFKTVQVNSKIQYNILSELKYEGKKITLKKPDVLVNGFYALII